MTTFNKNSHLCLIDASTYIFRAYHVMPPLSRGSDGLPVGAVNGFCSMLHSLMNRMAEEKHPLTHIAAIFDASGKSFRNEIYKEYKAHRPPAPEDLVPQFPLVRQAAKAFGLPVIEMDGLEADDIIASYATQAEKAGAKTTIISSDKDLMQLISKNTLMLDTMKDKIIDIAGVKEKFGVAPDRVTHIQALIGDSSDNVPGAPGIGIKSALKLLEAHGDLETLLKESDKIENKRWRSIIIDNEKIIRMSYELVCLKTDITLPFKSTELVLTPPEPDKLIGFLKEMEFKTLTQRIAKSLDVSPDDIQPTAETPKAKKQKPQQLNLNVPAETIPSKVAYEKYKIITSNEALEQLIADITEQGFVAFDSETTSLDAMRAEIVGLSFALEPQRAFYIPLMHKQGEQLKRAPTLKKLKPILQDPAVLKIAHNAKYDQLVLRKYHIKLTPIEDTMLLSYALDVGRHRHGLDALAFEHFGHKMISYKEVTGAGKQAVTFDEVSIEKAAQYAAEDADMTLRLYLILRQRLINERMTTLYETIERPLIDVLVDMEAEGIKIDDKKLTTLSKTFEKQINKIAKDAYKEAGTEFNLGSPKQIADILFGIMNLPGGKKTKTGQWSTSVSVLDDLAGENIKLAQIILDWRHLAKLKSTYTDALPNHINPETKRVHTSFALAATSTGRLASTEPNLQNIPIRSDEGRQIRQAFIAEKGSSLISADYSQIELRLLAHIAHVKGLIEAFHAGQDIHAATASEVFGTPLDELSSDQRHRAKAINFGIIYGISAFGLARQLAIPVGEASQYIQLYFSRYPEIKIYMDNIKKQVKTQLYVETLFGRRCHFPHIKDKSAARRGFFERAAINAPIQGTAADLIRRAMIKMPQALEKAKLKTKMLLQVHDELIFEAPQKELAQAKKVIHKIMSEAALPAVELAVPIEVEVKAAKNWDEAH